MDAKQKKLQVQSVIVIGCVILGVLMVVALFVNLARIISLKNREAELVQKLNELDAYIAELDEKIDSRQTAEYIDRYVREYLNMKGEDEITFIAK